MSLSYSVNAAKMQTNSDKISDKIQKKFSASGCKVNSFTSQIGVLQKSSIILQEINNHKLKSIQKKRNKLSKKKDANWNSHGASSSILLMQGAKLHFISSIT